MSGGQDPGAKYRSLIQENDRLRAQAQAMNETLARETAGPNASGGSGDAALLTRLQREAVRNRALEERCEALVKERRAVQTIMELKINVLVNQV